MASLAGRMAEFRELGFGIHGEAAVISGTEVLGKFFNRYRELDYSNGTTVGLSISFDCQWQDFMADLEEGDTITIKYRGTDKADESYRFLRRIPPGGDESGKVTLELGTVL